MDRTRRLINWNSRKVPSVYALALLLLLPTAAPAGGPAAQIKSTVDQVVKLLTDPRLKGDATKEERRKLLRKAIFSRFDFQEMAQRSLGAHWRRRTPEEQKEFVRIFTYLLEKAYVDRIESYTNETFLYTGERIERGYAEVSSKVATSKGEEFKIDYRLHRAGNEWKIYDVAVEDISLVNNYRSQFNRVINNSSYEELVLRMKQKVSETTDN